MKKLIFSLFVLAGMSRLSAQQSPIYTQYMFNPFILNPAIAGTVNYFQIKSDFRFQWIGIPDAPVTNSLSVFGPMSAKSMDMGYGATVYSDITGPTSRLGLRGAYAYNLAVNDEIRVSLGAAFGFMQYKIDGTQISGMKDAEAGVNGVNSFFQPDGMIGAYMYSTNFQVSFSADNLFNNKFDVDPQAIGIAKLERNYYLLGAYTYIFNRTWSAEGSTLIKGVSPAPLQADFNVRVIYQKTGWVGISFRSQESISLLGGYIINKRLYLGYSFDYNISDIMRYSLGSHELMIGYRFNTLK